MDRVERANIARSGVAELLFGAGVGFVGAMTALPLLLQQLGAGKVALGLAFGICTAGWILLQPLGMVLFGLRPRRKRFVVIGSGVFSVPCYLAAAAVVGLVGPRDPALCVALLLVILAVRFMGEGSIVPFWMEWQATIFRQEIRGRAIGLIAGAANLGGCLAALTAGAARRWVGFPQSYVGLYVASAAFCGASLLVFAKIVEPAPDPARPSAIRLRELAGRFLHSLRDRSFLSYLVARVLLTLGGGGSAFYAVHFGSPEGGGLSDSTVIAFGAFLMLPQVGAGYVLGRLGDRKGHKAGVLLGAAAQAASILVAFLGRGQAACIAAFTLIGVAWISGWVSHQNMLFETCPHDNRVAHITASNLVLGPFVMLVPLATGWMMQHLVTVRTGLGLTLIPTLLGTLWLIAFVKEPRAIELP